MDNDDLLSFIACSRLKSTRRRKRLQKKHAEKQLLKLDRKQTELYRQRRDLPMVPLDEPYQKGWKRSFVLRDDVARSKHAAFYEELLPKINTVQYAIDKIFLNRKRRKGRKQKELRTQQLRRISSWEWTRPDSKFTDQERLHFHPEEVKSKYKGTSDYEYVFNEPWRYTLRIKPHFITHVKLLDSALQQAIDQLDHHIERNHLQCKITKLTRGNLYHYWKRYPDSREANPIKHKPLHQLVAMVKDGEL